MGITFAVPKRFNTNGIHTPKIIKIDCLEKKPEFLIEYPINSSKPIPNKA